MNDVQAHGGSALYASVPRPLPRAGLAKLLAQYASESRHRSGAWEFALRLKDSLAESCAARVLPRSPGDPVEPAEARPATPTELAEFFFAYLAFLVVAADSPKTGRRYHTPRLAWEDLRSQGIGDGVIAWMIYQKHIEVVNPGPAATDGARPSILPRAGSWLALERAGKDFAELLLSRMLNPAEDAELQAAWAAFPLGRLTPRYDRASRRFSWGRHLLKQFRQPSVNQELILSTAEELSWPDWFDDPLPGASGVNRKLRLHDTIKDLNRRQARPVVHFKGDGTGTRVGWELC